MKKDVVSVLTGICPQCLERGRVDVPVNEWVDYVSSPDKLIQRSLKSLTQDEREQIRSGFHGECFDDLMLMIEEDSEI